MTKPRRGRPRVSVIMPFFDLERFIQESIESVIGQRFESWELLLIDDGSTDGSAAIARDFAARHPDWILYLTHPGRENRGASASRNLGMQRSSGEYYAFLDADDVWAPGMLEHNVSLLDRRPDVGGVYGSTLYWYSWTGDPRDRQKDYIADPGFPSGTVIVPPGLLIATLERRAPVPCTCSLLLRRSAVDRVGGFVEEFRRVYTDQAFYAKVFLEEPLLTTSSCFARYRRHAGSSVTSARETGEIDRFHLNYLRWLEAYLQQKGRLDRDLERALHRALWPFRHPALNRAVRGYHRVAARAAAAARHGVGLAFALSRLVLPRAARRWIWARLGKDQADQSGGASGAGNGPTSPPGL